MSYGLLEIRDDRDLLDALGMNDAEAANYLGKSRQALNNQLGPKRRREGGTPVADDYFKLSEILVLVLAAQQSGTDFDADAVRRYVEATRKPAQGKPDEASYKLLRDTLTGSKNVNVTDAAAIVLILPAFIDMRFHAPAVVEELRQLLSAGGPQTTRPRIVILSSDEARADMAAGWLKLPQARTAGHKLVEHYVPTLLVYDRLDAPPRPFLLTHHGKLMAAPQFRASAMAECVNSMMPKEILNDVFLGGGGGGGGHPAQNEAAG